MGPVGACKPANRDESVTCELTKFYCIVYVVRLNNQAIDEK